MSTPQPPQGNPADQPADPPSWGQQPAGGWGRPAPADGQQSWDPDRTSAVDPRTTWGQGGDPGNQPYGGPQYGQQDPYGQQQPTQYGAPPPYGQQPTQYGPQPTQQWSGDQQAWGGPQPTQQWPGQQQGYGAPPVTPPRARSGSSKLPLILGGAAVLVAAVVAVLGFVTPGFFVTKVFDAGALQTGVTKVLTESYGLPGVTGVTCRSGIQVTNGASFDCDATIDGETKKVPIKVTSSDGNYEVGRPL